MPRRRAPAAAAAAAAATAENNAAIDAASATASMPGASLAPPPANDAESITGTLAKMQRRAAASLLILLVGLIALHAFLGEVAVVSNMVAAFEAGDAAAASWWLQPRAPWAPAARLWDDAFRAADLRARVPRPALVWDLAALLRPIGGVSNQYVLVVGESGTGKSTAVRNAVRELLRSPGAAGVLYFSAPEIAGSFSRNLAPVLGYFRPFDPLVSFMSWFGVAPLLSDGGGAEPQATWAALRASLHAAAAAFHAKHGRPAVLVIDAADYVAKQERDFFLRLQDFAKVCADAGSLRIVFVSSEGVALPLMQSSSAWSRVRMPPYEVQDVEDELAVEYLVSCGISPAVAAETVRSIAGGRFSLLLSVASAAATEPIEAIRRKFDIQTHVALQDAGVEPANDFFRALVAPPSKRVAADEARLAMPRDKLDALLKANIIALHPDGTFSAHARHVESFFLRRAWAGGSSGRAV